MENQHRTFLWVRTVWVMKWVRGGGRVSLSKDINFLVSQHKAYKKHRNSSMESVSRLYWNTGRKKKNLSIILLTRRRKCCLQVVLFFFFYWRKKKRRAPPVFVAASVQHGITDRESSIFLYKNKNMKKKNMCSVLAWETKHFSPVEIS